MLLADGRRVGRPVQTALGEIDFLLATLAKMFSVKLIGEDLRLPAAVRTFAGEGFQMFHTFKSRAMHGCSHNRPPSD
jgi:hypothetical protein